MRSRRTMTVYTGAIAILTFTLLALNRLDRPAPYAVASSLHEIPEELAGWKTVRSEHLGPAQRRMLRPTDYIGRVYRKNESEIGAFIAYYAVQRAGEAMHSPTGCLPGDGWTISAHDRLDIPWKSGTAQINRLRIQRGKQRLVALYWYQSAQRVIASEYLGKVLLVRDAIRDSRRDGSLVRLIYSDTPNAEDGALNFAASLMSEVHRFFGQGRAHELENP